MLGSGSVRCRFLPIAPIVSPPMTRTPARGRARSARRLDEIPPLAASIRQAYRGRLTQTELAGLLGVAQNTISRWSTGEVEPALGDIARLESACGLPRGFVLRSAGYVDESHSAEDAIATDPRLDTPRRELILATYRVAVAQSAGQPTRTNVGG